MFYMFCIHVGKRAEEECCKMYFEGKSCNIDVNEVYVVPYCYRATKMLSKSDVSLLLVVLGNSNSRSSYKDIHVL